MCGGGLEHRHNIIRINITAAAGQDQEAGPGLGGKLQPTLPLLSSAWPAVNISTSWLWSLECALGSRRADMEKCMGQPALTLTEQ